MTIFARWILGRNPGSARKAFWVLISEIAKITRRTKANAHFCFDVNGLNTYLIANKRGIFVSSVRSVKVFGDTYWLTGLMNRVSRFSCAISLKQKPVLVGLAGILRKVSHYERRALACWNCGKLWRNAHRINTILIVIHLMKYLPKSKGLLQA